MSYLRPIRFEPGQFLRDCDLCGVRYRSGELVRGEDGFWRCKKYCVEVPAITRDRISMQSNQRREAPPAPWGKPYDQKNAYTEEAVLFSFLVLSPFVDPRWPGGLRFGAAPSSQISANSGVPNVVQGGGQAGSVYSYLSINETCRYLYLLITENRRPSNWISAAKTKLREQADLLITYQTLSGTADTNSMFGGFNSNQPAPGSGSGFDNFVLFDNAGCGLTLLYAYLTLGDSKYLVAAKNTANAIRTFQWSSNYTVEFTSSDSAGANRMYTGAHVNQISNGGVGTYVPSSRFFADSLIAVEFLNLLKSTDGDNTYGGTCAASNPAFVSSSSATLSSMISDALSFWKNGFSEVFSGQKITGLSSTTPRHLFNAFPQTKSGFPAGTGNWEYVNGSASVGTQIFGTVFSQGLRSLFAVNGYDAQVSSVWTWLMSFSSNPAFVGATGTTAIDAPVALTAVSANPTAPPVGQGNIVNPSYDPTIALSQTLTVRDSANAFAPIAINSNSSYKFLTSGCLAAIQSAKDGSKFRRAKDIIATTRFRIIPDFVTMGNSFSVGTTYPITEYLFMRETGSLAFTASGANIATYVVGNTAMAGLIFRYAPSGFVSEGRPDRTQPGANPGTMQD
jgi:hypothetical protein